MKKCTEHAMQSIETLIKDSCADAAYDIDGIQNLIFIGSRCKTAQASETRKGDIINLSADADKPTKLYAVPAW